MALASTTTAEDLDRSRGFGSTVVDNTRPLSAVSWGAIAAGAAAAAALSLILLILGVGLGLSSVSPWAQGGVGATAFGVSTIAWLTLTQLLASGMGGYLAGRLRTRWTQVHRDEVYFRDTAHGFLAWAVASLATAALLTSVIGSILGGGVQAGAALVGGVASTASVAVGGAALGGTTQANDNGPMAYFVDALFRRNTAALADPAAPADAASAGAAPPATPASSASVAVTAAVSPATNAGSAIGTDALERNAARDAAEVSRIFMNVSRSEPLPVEDVRYVGQIVAQRTGLSQQDAEKRVASVYARAQAKVQSAEVAARDAADKARKASAYSALWLFVSLLIGAFVASLAATFGGQRRDA
jgi:hypothetical protein